MAQGEIRPVAGNGRSLLWFILVRVDVPPSMAKLFELVSGSSSNI
jgi:hypothetical protein